MIFSNFSSNSFLYFVTELKIISFIVKFSKWTFFMVNIFTIPFLSWRRPFLDFLCRCFVLFFFHKNWNPYLVRLFSFPYVFYWPLYFSNYSLGFTAMVITFRLCITSNSKNPTCFFFFLIFMLRTKFCIKVIRQIL